MKKTILVVDDSPDITMTLQGLLEEESGDYKVVIAESGEECLKILNQDLNPDAILMDIMMPGMDGMETYEHIRENDKWSNIPVLFLTARTDHFTEGAGQNFGDDFIKKPFQIDDVIVRIEQAIESHKE